MKCFEIGLNTSGKIFNNNIWETNKSEVHERNEDKRTGVICLWGNTKDIKPHWKRREECRRRNG